MTPEEFRERMEQVAEGGDTEAKHGEADRLMIELLRSLGYGEGCDIFDRMDRWYA